MHDQLRNWKDDPLDALLEPENPCIRARALVELLGRPAVDAEVRKARAAIPAYPPLAALLAAQHRDGYWDRRDYYLPKHSGTFWVLSMLADAGLTREEEPVHRACEFMFSYQREHGSFCRRRRVAGRGLVWEEAGEPCTHARIVRFLIQFGYGTDPRLRAAVDWLLAGQRPDGAWHCRPRDRHGCLRATLDVLRAAALDAQAASHPGIRPAVEWVGVLMMKPGMSRYHVGGAPWTVLRYPYFDAGLLPALDALARLGYGDREPGVAAALDYLLSRRGPDGLWPLDATPYRLPFSVGQVGEPNKWLTLDALRVLALYNVHG